MSEPNDYITRDEAARLCPGRPHPASIWRWTRWGVRTRDGQRIYLRHLRVGSRLLLKVEWLDEFMAAVAAADGRAFAAPVAAVPPAGAESATGGRRPRASAVEPPDRRLKKR